jgi:L-ascorbate metabolism protein UlaG (beta-lactamase superfamily)
VRRFFFRPSTLHFLFDRPKFKRELMGESWKQAAPRIGARFSNPPWAEWREPELKNVLRWSMSRKPPKFPLQEEAFRLLGKPAIDPNVLMNPSSEQGMQCTWMGHASSYVQMGTQFSFITDPMFSDRCSPLSFAGPKRMVPPPCEIKDLPRVDAVLVSHNHYDHLDEFSIRELESQFSPVFFCGLGLKSWFESLKIDPTRIVEMDWWQANRVPTAAHNSRFEVTFVPAQHWSKRTALNTNKTLWGGFFVRDLESQKSFYFAGDTGYNKELWVEMHNRMGVPTVCALPIGAYEPRWFMAPQHINAHEAVIVHKEMHARFSYGIHWGTFILTDEPIDEPPKQLKEACEERGVKFGEEFRVLGQGETWVFE